MSKTAAPRARFPRAALAVVVAATLAAASLADAKTLRWAGRGDPQTMDPYSQNENLTNNLNNLIYDALVMRDKDLKVIPGLATSWEQVNATTWRFKLRPGVKWHDGSAFTADDVVFSIQRAAEDTSQIRNYANAAGKPRKIDDLTVEFVTNGPNPIMLEHLVTLMIMPKAWCEKNKCMKPLDFKNKEEMITSRNANGTGPFMLKSREPDVKTHLVKNPNWWGWKEKKFDGNVDEIVYTPITNDATRLAALVAGNVDVINDPAPQDVQRLHRDPKLKVMQGPELRTIFLGLDQKRDELLYSSVKGKNPFKDRRVRQAFYQAIDIDAIRSRIMRGSATPTGLMVAPGVNGFDPALNKRLPHDPSAAKKLLADAGYPGGFEVTLNCPNDRYVNDSEICQAVAVMLARVGVKVNLLAEPKATYFPKVLSRDTSFYLIGWTPGTYDSQNPLFSLMATPGEGGQGQFNLGAYSNPQVDELTRAIASEIDAAKRQAMISEAFRIHAEDIGHIPLHQQMLTWGMKKNVELVQLADNFNYLRWVVVK